MPATPVLWTSIGNTINAKTTGTQNDPAITQLTNGNVLISWVDEDDTPAAKAARSAPTSLAASSIRSATRSRARSG